ncbi:MAG TPA: acyl-CoA dehydrogenase family protein [Acidimicrobiales bacterium]|nr:acyl-CoA dehydrogenase family protein [Acidimicrobiales bacterium]
MTAPNDFGREFSRRAGRIGAEVAGPSAAEVDRSARFPNEAIEALRAESLLSILIPTGSEVAPATLGQVADVVFELGQHCASTAMIYAMHQIQVACIVRHGRSDLFHDYLADVTERQLLLASATTEAGVGGDVRTSMCAVEHAGAGRIRLEKQTPVISYGEYADAVLTTARRGPDSPPNDQVLVLCRPPGLTLEPTSGWDTLGFRGTCSLGFRLVAEGEEGLVLSDPYADILSQTMLPVSHILWSSVWLGLATAATDRARRFVRAEAHKKPGVTPPAALRLAELMVELQRMEEVVHGMARRFDRECGDPDLLAGMGFAIAMNSLKVSSSTLVVDIVNRAMAICGMAGYREDSPFSLGRILRDAHGAAVMVNNDRIYGNTAQMLLIHREH